MNYPLAIPRRVKILLPVGWLKILPPRPAPLSPFEEAIRRMRRQRDEAHERVTGRRAR